MGVLDFIFKGLGFEAEDEQRDKGNKMQKKNIRNKPVVISEHDVEWAELENSLLQAGSPRSVQTIDRISDAKRGNVAILEPRTFNELRAAVEFLQTKQPALVNLNNLENGIRQRGIDFFGGAVFALKGKLEMVSEGMYMFAPDGVGLFAPSKSRAKNDKKKIVINN